MPRARRIDHVSIAVESIDDALGFFETLFDVDRARVKRFSSPAFDGAMFAVGDSKFELLAPADPDGFLARFLQTRGPGVHHVTMHVENLDAMRARLRERDIPHFGDTTDEGIAETYIHPRHALGVLFQLLEEPWTVEPQDPA